MSEQTVAKFKETLTKHYTELFKTDKEYTFASKLNTPEQLAVKMTRALLDGNANKDGTGIKRTCKELGISYTYKAIESYLNGE